MTSRKQKYTLAIAVFAVVCVVAYLLFPRQKPTAEVVLPKPEVTGTIFSSLSASNTYVSTSGWAAGANAHAEWFVPDRSGNLSAIEIAIEPSYVRKGRENTAGDLDLFLAQDESGFPGPILEQFSLAATAPSSPPPSLPLVFKSIAHPKLQAGVKYWLCAGCSGPGSWLWRNNDQNLRQVSALEQEPGKWHSAGNSGLNGAVRVIVTFNK